MEGEHRARFKLATFHAVSRLIRCHRSFSFPRNFSLIFDFVVVVVVIIIIIIIVVYNDERRGLGWMEKRKKKESGKERKKSFVV